MSQTADERNVNVSTIHATILSIFPDAELAEDSDGKLVVHTGLSSVEFSSTEMVRGRFIKPQPAVGPTPEGYVRIMVLDDGETYSGLDGCTIREIPDNVEDYEYVDTTLKDGLFTEEGGVEINFVAAFDGNGLEV